MWHDLFASVRAACVAAAAIVHVHAEALCTVFYLCPSMCVCVCTSANLSCVVVARVSACVRVYVYGRIVQRARANAKTPATRRSGHHKPLQEFRRSRRHQAARPAAGVSPFRRAAQATLPELLTNPPCPLPTPRKHKQTCACVCPCACTVPCARARGLGSLCLGARIRTKNVALPHLPSFSMAVARLRPRGRDATT